MKRLVPISILWCALIVCSQGQLWIYQDALVNSWQDWSWSCTRNFSTGSPVYDGTYSLSVAPDAWGALSLYHAQVEQSDYGMLEFYIRGSQPGIQVWISFDDSGTGQSSDSVLLNDPDYIADGTITTSEWKRAQLRLSTLPNMPAHITRVNFFNNSGSAAATYYLDDIRFTDKSALPPLLQSIHADHLTQVSIVFDQPLDPASAAGGVYALQNLSDSDYITPQYGTFDNYDTNLDATLVSYPYNFKAGSTYYLSVSGVSNAYGVGLESTVTGTFSLGSAILQINISSNLHAISPYIYGMAFGDDAAYLQEAGVTVNRSGGNARTKYNWKIGASNTGADWYYENMNAHGSSGQNTPHAFISRNSAAGCATMITMPTIDWVAKDTTSYSYSVAKYGSQDDTDYWKPDAGNGLQGDVPILADPTDAYVPNRPYAQAGDPSNCVYQDEWLQSMLTQFGSMTADAITFLSMDNESDIWRGTHMDAHPLPVTYEELRDKFLTYASMTRSNMPQARITGPVSTGWWFYWNSDAGADDKAAHGNQDFLPWFLDEVRAHDTDAGIRTLDVLDIHYYPSGIFNSDIDAATRAQRLRTSRSFWDPSYQDEGWIGTDRWSTETQPNSNNVQLIPRFQQLIEDHYPGTKLGITEWNMGGENDISGALAVADVLGIFGRENLFLGTYWASPDFGSPVHLAFKLYGNYDNNGSRFAPLSVDAVSSDQGNLSVYAAISLSGEKLTLVSINKNPTQDITAAINITGFIPDATAQVYTLSISDPTQIIAMPAITNAAPSCIYSFPSYSASMLVFSGPVIDTNSNTLPDPWEQVYPVGTPDADDDNDQATNYEEYQAGTDPLDSNSVFNVRMHRTVTNMTIGIKSIPGRQYQLETTTHLTPDWNTNNTLNGNSALLFWDIPLTTNTMFYRVTGS